MRVCPPMAGRDLSLCRDSANETKGARPLIVKYHLSYAKIVIFLIRQSKSLINV